MCDGYEMLVAKDEGTLLEDAGMYFEAKYLCK